MFCAIFELGTIGLAEPQRSLLAYCAKYVRTSEMITSVTRIVDSCQTSERGSTHAEKSYLEHFSEKETKVMLSYFQCWVHPATHAIRLSPMTKPASP